VSTGATWQPAQWAREHTKHHPRYYENWAVSIRRTAGREGNARYSPQLTLADIERIEMEAVSGMGIEILPPRRRLERVFWRRLLDEVGASKGERTDLIYVIYNQSGAVHGYSITESELGLAGAIL